MTPASRAVLIGVLGLVSALGSVTLRAQTHEGERLYRIHCEACHGRSGRGDGPMSGQLEQPVPDLTTLAQSRGGDFPSEEIAEVIDGRRETPSHGTRQMPVWGFTFQSTGLDSDQEEDVKALIVSLTSYLESIQRQQNGQNPREPEP